MEDNTDAPTTDRHGSESDDATEDPSATETASATETGSEG